MDNEFDINEFWEVFMAQLQETMSHPEPELINTHLVILLYFFFVGTCFGSLANVMVFRLPLGKSMIRPSSYCPACEHRILVFDLVPVLSYFILLGKCRHCKAKISIRYPIVEFLCGVLFAACAALYAFPAMAWFSLLCFALLTVTLIDMKVQEIPDSMVALIAVSAIAWLALGPESISPAEAAIGAAAGALPLLLLDRITLLALKKDGFGYGDVKLMGAAGLFLGWQGVAAAFFIAFVSGAAAAVAMMKLSKVERGGYIAFGPFLCAGILAAAWSHALLGHHLIEFLNIGT